MDSGAVFAMTAFAALAVGLLLSHQPPQIETDRVAGKLSFAVRYGEVWTYRIARILLGVFLESWGMAVSLNGLDSPAIGLAIYTVAAAWIMAIIVRPGLGPKRMLVSATVFVAVIVAVQNLMI